MVTGGMCVILTSDGGCTDSMKVLQFSISATEQGQNYWVAICVFCMTWLSCPPLGCSAYPEQSLPLKGEWSKKGNFSATLSLKKIKKIKINHTTGFPERSHWAGKEKRGEGKSSFPFHSPQHPTDQEFYSDWLCADSHTVNDSKGSGTTERIGNNHKND